MPALSPKVFALTLDRDANTRPKALRHFQANPCIWRLSLGASVTFDGATRVAVELNTKSDGSGEVLAAAETTAGLDDEAETIDVAMTAAQWNQSISNGKTERTLWAVAYVEYPDDRLEIHTVAKVTLVRHAASQTTPAPPEPAVYLSQAALDALEASLQAEIDALEATVENLSTVHNDLTDRDAEDAHPIAAITNLASTLVAYLGRIEDLETAAATNNTQHGAISDAFEALETEVAGKANMSHTHTIDDVSGLNDTLAYMAPLESPHFHGNPVIYHDEYAPPSLRLMGLADPGNTNWALVNGLNGAGLLEFMRSNDGSGNPLEGVPALQLFSDGTVAVGGGLSAASLAVTDAATTRSNLGLGTGDAPQFAGLQFSTDLFLQRGAAANLRLGGAASATPVSQYLSVQNASGTNVAGADRYIQGSAGTGSGAGGEIVLLTAPAGSPGTGQNSFTSQISFTSTGGLRWGASGPQIRNDGPRYGSTAHAFRSADNSSYAHIEFRSCYCAENFYMHSGGALVWDNRVFLVAETDKLVLKPRSGSSPMLAFAGTTSACPAFKYSGTTLQCRLADDSAFAPIQGKLTTDDNAATGTITPDKTLTIYDATGTAYKVPCVAA